MITTPKKPVHTIRRSHIHLAVWAHPTPKGTNYSISLERRYKKDNEWKCRRSGFFREDVEPITEAVKAAAVWIESQGKPEPKAE
ncbi:MAG: hypothetical protein U0638_05515 [Phycisphaerales bacterium]